MDFQPNTKELMKYAKVLRYTAPSYGEAQMAQNYLNWPTNAFYEKCMKEMYMERFLYICRD